jgi:hypothetical protein
MEKFFLANRESHLVKPNDSECLGSASKRMYSFIRKKLKFQLTGILLAIRNLRAQIEERMINSGVVSTPGLTSVRYTKPSKMSEFGSSNEASKGGSRGE